MVDYLESLERLAMPDDLHIKECKKLGIGLTEDYEVVEQALHRLESIDNANSSEALEILDDFKNGLVNKEIGMVMFQQYWFFTQIEKVKQALLKAQEQELHNGGRLPNKEILSLKQCVEQCKDKPILYISETYGNKYIVPQKELDDLTKEKELSKGQMKYLTEVVSEFQKIVRIIKPSLRLVGNCLQAKAPFVDDYHPWVFIKEITDEEELKLLKEMLE